jgi:hypothetical protein
MEETQLEEHRSALRSQMDGYLRERVAPHPLLAPYLHDAAALLTGSVAFGTWDEDSSLDFRFVVPDADHARLAAGLQAEHLWEPGRDFRVSLRDREPYRRFPGAELVFLSATQFRQEFRFELAISVWTYSHSVPLHDPSGLFGSTLEHYEERFRDRLANLRCEHYYNFREARNDLLPKVTPGSLATVLAIKRGEAVREALRLAFLAESQPYPYDKWLETIAEQETECGAGIVTAVRALVAARETHTIERAGKVLRDRVAFALQQGGVSERWLEQWWLWPSIAPTLED